MVNDHHQSNALAYNVPIGDPFQDGRMLFLQNVRWNPSDLLSFVGIKRSIQKQIQVQ